MKQLTIKETIDNMIDELTRATQMIADFNQGEYVDDLDVCELRDDIKRTLQDELSYFKERIDLAMLMSGVVGDVALPTINEIYKVEANYELPIMENGLVDTETVYNTVEEVVAHLC